MKKIKVVKDIGNKYRVLLGKKVSFLGFNIGTKWKELDYFYSVESARDYYEDQLKLIKEPEQIIESDWIK